jgi:hypothetical protein
LGTRLGQLLSVGGMGIVGLSTINELTENRFKKTWPICVLCAVPPIGSFTAFSEILSSHKKDQKKHPVLIFDEEGFTYKKSMGLFQGRKYVRYLWKDVISHWVTGVVDGWGQELQKTWCYHIKGKKEIVKIDATELDIPEELEAKVESLRMGNIQALFF